MCRVDEAISVQTINSKWCLKTQVFERSSLIVAAKPKPKKTEEVYTRNLSRISFTIKRNRLYSDTNLLLCSRFVLRTLRTQGGAAPFAFPISVVDELFSFHVWKCGNLAFFWTKLHVKNYNSFRNTLGAKAWSADCWSAETKANSKCRARIQILIQLTIPLYLSTFKTPPVEGSQFIRHSQKDPIHPTQYRHKNMQQQNTITKKYATRKTRVHAECTHG